MNEVNFPDLKGMKGRGKCPIKCLTEYEWAFQDCALGRFGILAIPEKLSLEMVSSSIVFPIKPFCQCSSELSHIYTVIYDVACNQGEVVEHLDPHKFLLRSNLQPGSNHFLLIC